MLRSRSLDRILSVHRTSARRDGPVSHSHHKQRRVGLRNQIVVATKNLCPATLFPKSGLASLCCCRETRTAALFLPMYKFELTVLRYTEHSSAHRSHKGPLSGLKTAFSSVRPVTSSDASAAPRVHCEREGGCRRSQNVARFHDGSSQNKSESARRDLSATCGIDTMRRGDPFVDSRSRNAEPISYYSFMDDLAHGGTARRTCAEARDPRQRGSVQAIGFRAVTTMEMVARKRASPRRPCTARFKNKDELDPAVCARLARSAAQSGGGGAGAAAQAARCAPGGSGNRQAPHGVHVVRLRPRRRTLLIEGRHGR